MKRRIFSSVIMLLMLLSQIAFAEPIYIPPAKWLTCFYVSGADLEREFGLWHNDMLGLEQRVLKPEVKHLLLFGGCKATRADILMRAGFPRQDIMCLQSDGWYSTGYNLNNPPMGEAKTLTAKLNENDINNLIMIESHLYIADNNSGSFYPIGGDTRINADWDTGEISYELPNNWFAIDGHVMPCYTTDIRNDSTIYVSPVKVNGEEGYLCFRSDDDKDNVEIIGVTKDFVSANYNQENMYQLKKGDTLTLCIIVPNNTSATTVNDLGTFTINEPPVIENKPLPAGKYRVCLSFVSANQQLVESSPVDFSI